MAIPAPFGNEAQVEPESLFDSRKATDLMRPALHKLLETGTTGAAGWRRIETQRPAILKVRGGAHAAQYAPWSPNDQTFPNGEFYDAPQGNCYLFGRGTWWVRVPETVVGAPVLVDFILLDAISVAATGLSEAMLTGSDTLVPSAPAAGVVGIASAAFLPANAARRQLFLKNLSAVATVSFSLNGGVAVLGSGVTLAPLESVVFESADCKAPFAAIASAAATPVAIQEWL